MERNLDAPWFPNRVDRRKAIRRMARWMAVTFNGIYLLGYFFTQELPPNGIVLFGLALMLVPLGISGMVSYRASSTDREQLEAIAMARGVTGRRWMRVAIYRQRVLIGRDEGWVGRREGALVFEGRTTRFEIVRDDLVYVPVGAVDEVPGRLTVKDARGAIDVWFTALPWEPKDSGADVILGWPDADRELPGPPIHPKPRTFCDRIRMAHERNEWTTWPFILFGLSFLLPPNGWPLIAIRLVLLVTGVAAAWIAFSTTWRKDDEAIARLIVEDAERLQTARNVVIETNGAGTGNPAVNAAVG